MNNILKTNLLELIKKYNLENKTEKILSYDKRIIKLLLDNSNYFIKVIRIIEAEKDIEICLKKLNFFKQLNVKGFVDDHWNYGKLSLEEWELLLTSKNDFNAYYAMYVLCDLRTIEVNLSFEGAKIIIDSPNGFNAHYAALALCNPVIIKAGIALDAGRILNESKTDLNAYYALRAMCLIADIDVHIALEGAKIINESPNYFNAYSAINVLRSYCIIEAGIALDGAKLVNKALSENIAVQIYKYLNDNAKVQNVLDEAEKLVKLLNAQEMSNDKTAEDKLTISDTESLGALKRKKD